MAKVASAAMEFTEVPPSTVPTVNVVLGKVGVFNSEILAIAFPWRELRLPYRRHRRNVRRGL